jgi:hypothetical protein
MAARKSRKINKNARRLIALFQRKKLLRNLALRIKIKILRELVIRLLLVKERKRYKEIKKYEILFIKESS